MRGNVASQRNKYLYFIFILSVILICIIIYYIYIPEHYDNKIKNNYFQNKTVFLQVLDLFKSHYPIYIYFHNNKKIDLRILKPQSEFDTYIDAYDIDINDDKVSQALKKVNLNISHLNKLYYFLNNLDCVSIGSSPLVDKIDGGAIEIGLYRNYIFGFWKYVFFDNDIDNVYLKKHTILPKDFTIIDKKVGWFIYH